MKTKRILFFAHYDIHNRIDDYVVYFLNALKKHVNEIIFISHSSSLDETSKHDLGEIVSKFIVKENKGFDFSAWKAGMLDYGFENLNKFDELLLVNDSCYGPLDSFDHLFKIMSNQTCDFWGVTENVYTTVFGDAKKHIQSYFLCFKSQIFKSKAFYKFFAQRSESSSFRRTILHYEVKMTRYFSKLGFKFTVYANLSLFDSTDKLIYDRTRLNPTSLLNIGSPLIKRKVFSRFQTGIGQTILKHIEDKNPKLEKIIRKHLYRVLSPSEQTVLFNPALILHKNGYDNNNCTFNSSVAIHVHLFYIDLLDECAHYINNCNILFDLFITTTSSENHEKIQNYFNTHNNQKIKNIFIKTIPNRGRNISSLLIPFKNELQTYDVVCHFHTKKSPDIHTGKFWRSYLLDQILGDAMSVQSILKKFENDKNIGLVFPPIWNDVSYLLPNLWGANKIRCRKMIKSLNLKFLPKEDEQMPIAPYGCMFWFRPLALKPLFDSHLDYGDFESEPWKSDDTLGHTIERLFVPIAISMGYRFYYTIQEKELVRSYLNHEWDLCHYSNLSYINIKTLCTTVFISKLKRVKHKILPKIVSFRNFALGLINFKRVKE